MASKQTLKRQQKIELSRADHGRLMAAALIEGMIQNPDSIVRSKGAGRLNIYKEILRDDQVKSCFQQRRTAVVHSEWDVEPASESTQDVQVAEFIKANLDAMRFDVVTDKMLYAVHYGYGVAEILWRYDEPTGMFMCDLKVRDRQRFGFDVNNELMLRTSDGKNKKMPADKFWVFAVGADHDDNPYGEGLAHALYWPVFFKRNGIKFWMIHLEKFGMPTSMAKLSRGQMKDTESMNMALDILDAIQVDSGVVVPEDFAVELLEASRSGTADYNTLKEGMDAAISKIILSQTMTTDDGSSHSQSKVHQDVKDDVVKTDADLICDSFNMQVVKQLVDLNFPGADYPKVWRRTEPEEDLAALAERDNKIMNLGYEPTEEYIEENYGPGWRKKEEPLPPVGQAPDLGPEFSEVSRLTGQRIDHRKDQQSLIDGAEYIATKYRELYGERIEQLLSYAEETGDLETFRERLDEMLKEPVTEQTAQIVENASWVARLMGQLKGERA